jgi:hypothetical protein
MKARVSKTALSAEPREDEEVRSALEHVADLRCADADFAFVPGADILVLRRHCLADAAEPSAGSHASARASVLQRDRKNASIYAYWGFIWGTPVENAENGGE